ncbi:MAG: D-alanine--D-alanine ligase [Anaerolineales bacterium]|nr:D-alanine--D-alanine ligase [Anaerolineales bacterium]
MGKLRIGVIYGGRSGEHEVSLMSARSVLDALDPARYEVVEIGITPEGRWMAGAGVMQALQSRSGGGKRAAMLAEPGPSRIWEIRPDGGDAELRLKLFREVDVVFPVLHGTFGEDGTLQGLLEMAEVPYVGAGVLASSVAMDKALFKQLMRAHAIPIPEYILCTRSEIAHDLDGAVRRAEAVGAYPLFTKPANLGSSVGISRCANRSDLMEGMADAARYDRRVLVERGIDAREIEVSVLGNERPEASVPGEVVPSREFYSYESKYVDGTSQLLIPAPIPEEKAGEIQRWAVEAYRAIDGAGLSRADFLMDRRTGEVFLNELNTMPGFTAISMYPKLWEKSGLPYPDLLDRLIDLALERHAERAKNERSYRRN